jgi:hypothetical protein
LRIIWGAFSKKEVKMAKKYMKKCLPSLTIKEMQIKTTLRFHLTSVRIASIKNTSNRGAGGKGERWPKQCIHI